MSDDRSILSDGECIIVGAGKHISLRCCDCGLVHDVWPSYDADKRMVSIMFVRDDDETKKVRRPLRRKGEGIFKRRKKRTSGG